MTAFELRPESSSAQTANDQLEWPLARRGEGAVHSELTPLLAELGVVPDTAIDLVRFATAAYLADERVARPVSWTRSIEVDVQLLNAPAWTDDVLGNLADLLESTTGDRWELGALSADPAERPAAPENAIPSAARVALLSGGLDSLSGAAITSAAGDTVYLGHWDIPTVKAAQDKVRRRFATAGRALDYVQIYHGLHSGKVEHSQRTRSLLFMSLAVALATARGARSVEVPENGFTSLNPPLGPERGGALTTRSTHPMTISRFNALLRDLGLEVVVSNPYQWLTKGELVAMAAPELPGFEMAIAETFSCAKMDGGRYKGGDWNKHCGLCYACIVRRGAVLASGTNDLTDYLSTSLPAESRQKLVARRHADIAAAGMLLESGVDDIDVLTLAPFPPEIDLDVDIERAVDLCRRGLDEIRRVPLP